LPGGTKLIPKAPKRGGKGQEGCGLEAIIKKGGVRSESCVEHQANEISRGWKISYLTFQKERRGTLVLVLRSCGRKGSGKTERPKGGNREASKSVLLSRPGKALLWGDSRERPRRWRRRNLLPKKGSGKVLLFNQVGEPLSTTFAGGGERGALIREKRGSLSRKKVAGERGRQTEKEF